MRDDSYTLHGNHARVDPQSPVRENKIFKTLVNTNYKTKPDGTVEQLHEDDARFCKEAVDENKK